MTMVVLLVAVFGLALIDSVNPSAIAVTLYLLLTGRSYTSRVLTYLAAVFSSYLLIGMLLILGLDAIWDYLYSPAASAVQGVVGALMLLYGILAPSGTAEERSTRLPRSQRLGPIFLLGVTITVVEFSSALPYLGAIAILTNADLAASQWVPVLVVYNLIFILPPLLMLGAYRLIGSRLQGRFEGYLEKLSRGSRSTLLWIMAIVGFVLLADSLRYFDFFGLINILDVLRTSENLSSTHSGA
jgi:cytochrome c biogenesis protein CcdA